MKRLPLPLILNVLAVVVLSASVAYWALQLYKPAQRPIAAPPPVVRAEPPIASAATLFGGAQVAAVASNYQLTGVVAAGRESVAIIVADGNPPKAVRLGGEVGPGVTVQEVWPRYVMLSENGVAKRVDLAQDARPAASMDTAPPVAFAPVESEPAQPAPEPVAPPPQNAPVEVPAASTMPGNAPAPERLAPPPGQAQPPAQQMPPPAFLPQPPVRMPPPVPATGVRSGPATQ